MTPEFDEVMLTAYLDDEVTDAEREKVEAQLRTSAASRKLLEELRSVRNLVTQLHLTQSTRSYQQGPWNQANSNSHEESSTASEISKVVLHDPRSRWKLPFQRLASLAALIAIAVCGRILLLQPSMPAISRSNDTRTSTKTEGDLKSRREISPTHDSEDFGLSDKAVPAPSGFDDVRSLNESANRDKSESDVKLSFSQGADRGRFGNTQLPPSPNFQVPIELGDEKSKSQLSENRPAEPASGAFDSYQPKDSPSLARKSTDSEVQKPSSKQSDQFFLEDLLKDQSREWKKRVVEEVESLDRKSSDPIDKFVHQENSISSKPDEPNTKFYFRYRNDNQLGRVTDESTALFKKGATTKESESVEFDKQPAEKQKNVVERPLLVEFEIPSNDWESGAKRLRQLGISVPLELPAVEYLEFTGVPIPSRWTFQRTDSLEGQRSLDPLAEKEGMLSKSAASVVERPGSIRIRVRAISTTEK